MLRQIWDRLRTLLMFMNRPIRREAILFIQSLGQEWMLYQPGIVEQMGAAKNILSDWVLELGYDTQTWFSGSVSRHKKGWKLIVCQHLGYPKLNLQRLDHQSVWNAISRSEIYIHSDFVPAKNRMFTVFGVQVVSSQRLRLYTQWKICSSSTLNWREVWSWKSGDDCIMISCINMNLPQSLFWTF